MKCLYVPKKVSSCLDDIRQRAGFHLTKKYQTIQKQTSHSGAKKASSCLDEVRQQTGILLLFFSPSHKTQYMSITKFRRQCITQVFAYPQESVKLPWRGEATNWRLVLLCRVWSHTVVFTNQEQTKQRLNHPKQINLNIHETKSAHPSNKKRLCQNYSCQYWEHCSSVKKHFQGLPPSP